MGMFNSACGVTGINIDLSEKTGFIILHPQNSRNKNVGNSSNSFLMTEKQYKFFLPPIYGTESGLGGIEDYDLTKNPITIKVIEEYYEQSLDEAISSISNVDKTLPDWNINLKPRQIKKINKRNLSKGLTQLGFTQTHEGYQQGSYSLIEIKTNHWIIYDQISQHYVGNAFISDQATEILENFHKNLNQSTTVPSPKSQIEETVFIQGGMNFHAQAVNELIKAYPTFREGWEISSEKIKENLEKHISRSDSEENFLPIVFPRERKNLLSLFLSEEGIQELTEAFYIEALMNLCSRDPLPIPSTSQMFDPELTIKLGEIYQKIGLEKQKEYDDF